MYGKALSLGTRVKISGTCKGTPKTEGHKAKIPKSLSKKVFVYSYSTSILEHEFLSFSEAARHFNCSKMSICRSIKSG